MNIHSLIMYRFQDLHWRWRIKTRPKSNDKYHRILEAAVKVFAKQGFYETTIAQIAREAGVADGTIYLYFKNKDDILVQFFEFKTKQVFDRFQRILKKSDNALEKLIKLIRRHFKEFESDMNMAMVYQSETRRNSPLVKEQIRQMSKMYLDIVAEIVEQGQVEGCFRKDLQLGLVKRYVLGAVEEVINTWILSGGKYNLVAMADPLVDLLIRGIGKCGSPTIGISSDPQTNKQGE
jgi:TetR/AcrR family transcriptional regulator, fatty acid metabolism regulator protein